MYNVESSDVWRPGSEPRRSSVNSAVPGTAVQSQSKNYPASCSRLWISTIKPPYTQQTWFTVTTRYYLFLNLKNFSVVNN